MRSFLAITIAVAFVQYGHAESFVDKLNQANAKLRNGESQAALDIYRELQVENPESDVLYHNLGCAQYSKGEEDSKSAVKTGKAESFSEAKASFERAMSSDDPALRKSATFNRANAVAQQAMAMDPAKDQKAVVAAFEDSIKSYEEILSNDPENKDAQTNLDHMRYLLKKMLQNPPEQNQQQQGKDDQGKEGDKQDQQQNQQGGDQQEQQPEQNDNQEQSKQDSEQKKERNQAQKQDEQQDQAQNPEQNEQQSPQQNENEQQNAAAQPDQNQDTNSNSPQNAKPTDMQAVEALLQSLDDQDQREQFEMRRAPRDTRLRGDWW
ncbi:MAG: hypothetical protein K1Y02_11980 [Candidatus Hydrogenedentes bacterium]|nr:hypothetical protein [Candidatus Hydrogenedentota bacterium]